VIEWIMLAGLIGALAVCALGVGLYAFYCAHTLSDKSLAAVEAARLECAAALNAMQLKLNGVAANFRETERPPPPGEHLPSPPMSCMNLTKRSKALRLSRNGDSPEKIAESLEIPRQEVELLLKVHEIVLNNL
jgi:DNA-binding NarL/FixJ family response regulator